MKKQFLLLGVLILMFSIVGVQAISPTSPASVSLSCGDYTHLDISGVTSNLSDITNTKWIKPELNVGMGFDFKNLISGGNTLKALFFTNTENCQPGSTSTTFNIGSSDYTINIEILKEEYKLGEKLISINEALKIGQDISFGVLGISEGSVHYILKGCQSVSEEDTMTDEISKTCSGNIDLRVKILTTIPELAVAKLEVFSSEPSFILTKSNQSIDDDDSSECVLGIDTLGAKVKRDSTLSFETINQNGGKSVPSVKVRILDQAGDLPPLSGESDNTGFFTIRLSQEDYLQDLIVKLEADNCEATNKIVLFEQSYDDYKSAKEEEEGAYKLVLNLSGKFEMKELSFTVKNALDEVVEGVEVKITKPDSSSFEVTTDSSGLFKWTPDAVGIWKVQGGLDGYESTQLNEIEVFQNKEYLIVIKVNGEQKGEYKKGDRISFELRENNTLIPLTIDATFSELPLRFINGISDAVTFERTSVLSIPATEGYIAQTITLSEKTTNLATVGYVVLIIIAILVVLILVVAVLRKVGGRGSKPQQKMEFQLGEGGK